MRFLGFRIFVPLFVFAIFLAQPVIAQRAAVLHASGIVHDIQGIGVHATVHLTAPDGQDRTLITDNDGVFSFDQIVRGQYQLRIEATGFETVTRAVNIVQDSYAIDVRLSVQGISTEITVTAAEMKATGSRTDVPDNEIPAQISTITASLLREQGGNDMISALRNASGVTTQKIYGVYEYYTIRGFNSNDSQLNVVLSDGMRLEGNRLNTQLNSVERIEVLKGPSSILYGSGALGGSINIIHKKPQAKPTFNLMYRGGSFGTNQLGGGAGGELFGIGRLLYRVDSSFENSGGWRGNSAKRFNVSPTLTWLIGNRTQFTASEFMNRDRFKTDAGIPIGVASIPSYNLGTRFDTPQDFQLGHDALTQLRLNVDLSERWEARDNFAYRVFDDQYYTAETLTFNPATTSVGRTFLYFKHHRRPKQNMADVLGHFHVAGTDHTLVAGYEFEDYYNYTDRSAASSVAIPSINIYTLQENYVPVSAFPISRRDYFSNMINAFYWQDQISLSKYFRINVGGRLDAYRRSSHNDPWANSAATSRTSDTRVSQNAYTYRAGVAFLPTSSQELYFSSASAFQPVTSVPANGALLVPERGRSFEGGYRWRPGNGRINLSSSIFYIARENVAIALTGGNFDQAGKESSRGADFDATGSLKNDLRVNANYGYSSPHFDNYFTSNGAVNLSGKRPNFSSRHAVNLWITKSWKDAFTTSLGMRYQSLSFVDNANTFRLGGFTVLQGAASYRHRNSEVSVNVDNLFNRQRYFPSGLGQSQLYPGAPISAYVTVRYRK